MYQKLAIDTNWIGARREGRAELQSTSALLLLLLLRVNVHHLPTFSHIRLKHEYFACLLFSMGYMSSPANSHGGDKCV